MIDINSSMLNKVYTFYIKVVSKLNTYCLFF